jgi:hypothetical protein
LFLKKGITPIEFLCIGGNAAQQAMKSNTNAAAGIGISFGLVAALAAPSALLVLRGASPLLVGCGVAAVGIVLASILLPALLSYADRRYGGGLELEV